VARTHASIGRRCSTLSPLQELDVKYASVFDSDRVVGALKGMPEGEVR
jgi:hypothetical protein